MTLRQAILIGVPVASILFCGMPNAAEVNITADLESVQVMHGDTSVVISRIQDPANTVNPLYAQTSRECPPFCIQPVTLLPGVETVGEIEVLAFLKRKSEDDDSIIIIDSRMPVQALKGTIPGAINLPWTRLDSTRGTDPIAIGGILEGMFSAKNHEGLWDFSAAKTLVFFCGGMWCEQSPNNIKSLVKFGYPAERIKWYRGGMQDWESLGLTTVNSPNSD